jgi:phosphoglycerol transferase MdoB-like AlkP superfamily enzyme
MRFQTASPQRECRRATAFARYRFAIAQVTLYAVLSLVLRIILAAKYGPGSVAQGLPEDAIAKISLSSWMQVFATGTLLDVMVALVIFMPCALWLAACPQRWQNARWQRVLFLGGSWFWWTLAIFLMQGEYWFFGEYTSRYNTVAIDYLHYWTEVSSNVAEMYPWKTIVAASIFGAAVAVAGLWRWFKPATNAGIGSRASGMLCWIGATAVFVWCATWLNFQVSSERVLNELSSNGLTSGAVALWTRELDYAQFFPTLPRDEAYARARHLLDSRGASWSADPSTIERNIAGDPARRKLNVILLLEESLGSEFWGCLNDVSETKSLTPHLDRIAESEGLLFTNLYADGNRTIRGIEGVLASFPPLPGDSLVARPKAHGCETLATTLGRDGYSTTFVYPGRGIFDGLGRFTLANGFDHFIEEKDFKNPVFTNTWGHCDEDLYDRVLQEAHADHESGRPFFITALSVTNHQPFSFPAGRIPEPGDRHSRKFAVKYVDYALGRFFEMAKREPFWKDTIFAVVADHGARVYGSQTVPILSYEVPLLVLGPAAVSKAIRIDTLGCQLDIGPTLLGLIGRPYESTFFGRDLLALASSRFALLNHNRSIAIYRESELVTLSLGKVIERFTRADRRSLTRQPLDSAADEAARDATALFQVADELYSQRRFVVRQDHNLRSKGRFAPPFH